MTQLAGGATASMVGTQSTHLAELPQHSIKNAVFSGFVKVFALGTATAQTRSPQARFFAANGSLACSGLANGDGTQGSSP
jgi:hypothetical protein